MNIIDGLQKKGIRIIEGIVTTMGWLLMLGYIIQIILSIILWVFNLSNFYYSFFIFNNINATIRTIAITVVISVCVFMLIYLWGKYNYKRFAHLKRRKFPENVTNDKIAEYFGLPLSLVEKMQNNKIIVIEKTIV
jgi:poly-beta-1,6-N-acetyl-D-glucosamine biosynthesis protein PgaD